MHFIIIGKDSTDAPRLRQEHLQAHLQFVESNIERIKIAGPMPVAENGYCGSCYVIEVPSAAAAEEFLAADPYDVAGVWKTVEILPFNPVAGGWVGGTTW